MNELLILAFTLMNSMKTIHLNHDVYTGE